MAQKQLRWTIVRPSNEERYGKYPLISIELLADGELRHLIRTKTYTDAYCNVPDVREVEVERPFEITPLWHGLIRKYQKAVDGIYKF